MSSSPKFIVSEGEDFEVEYAPRGGGARVSSLKVDGSAGGAVVFGGNTTRSGASTITGATTYGAGANLTFDATTGTKIGTAATEKIGFWNATPVVQPSGVAITTAGFVAGAGAAVLVDSTFTGNSGTKAYHISDVVRALKDVGILAAS